MLDVSINGHSFLFLFRLPWLDFLRATRLVYLEKQTTITLPVHLIHDRSFWWIRFLIYCCYYVCIIMVIISSMLCLSCLVFVPGLYFFIYDKTVVCLIILSKLGRLTVKMKNNPTTEKSRKHNKHANVIFYYLTCFMLVKNIFLNQSIHYNHITISRQYSFKIWLSMLAGTTHVFIQTHCFHVRGSTRVHVYTYKHFLHRQRLRSRAII